MKPRGAPPAALSHLDDVLLDAACCADTQLLNTEAMLEVCERILAAGRMTSDHTEDVRYLRRHVRLEDQLNRDQLSLLRWGRWSFDRVALLLQEYRRELQVLRTAEAAQKAASTLTPAQ